jgi:hypothetical protein
MLHGGSAGLAMITEKVMTAAAVMRTLEAT